MRRDKAVFFGVMIGLAAGALLLGAALILSLQPEPGELSSFVGPFPTVTPLPPGSFAALPFSEQGSLGLGIEVLRGDVGLRVTGVVRDMQVNVKPGADAILPREDQEYLWVEITVRCVPEAIQNCMMSYDDFGLRSAQGGVYSAESPTAYDMDALFETFEMEPGTGRFGALIYIIQWDDSR